MDDWIDFEAQIVPMPWGKSVFTVLPIPGSIANRLNEMKAKRVEIELNDVPLNLALTKSPVIPQTFVYTGKSVLKEVGIEPGEIIDVRLRVADPDEVDEPSDVIIALRDAGVLDHWKQLTPGKKRGHLHQVVSAKRAETRTNRIAKLVALLGYN